MDARWTHDGHTVDTRWTLRWTQRWTLVKHTIFKKRPNSSRTFCTQKYLLLGACVQGTVFYQCPPLCPSLCPSCVHRVSIVCPPCVHKQVRSLYSFYIDTLAPHARRIHEARDVFAHSDTESYQNHHSPIGRSSIMALTTTFLNVTPSALPYGSLVV